MALTEAGMQGDLFDDSGAPSRSATDGPGQSAADSAAPLAERMRPADLSELMGQDDVVGPGSLLRDLIERDRVPSMILWGPPGCGKTSLARLVATKTGMRFIAFSAVLSGVKEVRETIAEARYQRRASRLGTLLFVDEIHRFNKAQQDAFLPHVEDGTIVLIGATTENPSFALNAALLSRCQVFTLAGLDRAALAAIVRRALLDPARYGLPTGTTMSDAAIERLVAATPADARALLNRLEALLERERDHGALAARVIDLERLERALQDPTLRYDRSGEDHFNVMSAFHKSVRGGDPQGALYWLTRMLASGEDRMWVARRLIRIASEDVGLADPAALTQALAAMESYRFLGSPEGELALVQAAIYLATAPKSNAIYRAYGAVVDELEQGEVYEVPLHLRNAPTRFMKEQGYGRDYAYPHDFDDAVAAQGHLPAELGERDWYRPSKFGFEKDIARRMEYWDKIKSELRERGSHDGG